jgi:predicted ribosome quality control (RQC) complex YloA/Tae2 family protein
LAKEFGVKKYPAPAGGCLLTDKNYSRRLRDILDREDHPQTRMLHLLRYGRHFRIDPATKIIIGRSSRENALILQFSDSRKDTTFKVIDFPGPIALLPDGATPQAEQLAAALCAGYSKAPAEAPVQVRMKRPQGGSDLTVFPIPPDDLRHLLL